MKYPPKPATPPANPDTRASAQAQAPATKPQPPATSHTTSDAPQNTPPAETDNACQPHRESGHAGYCPATARHRRRSGREAHHHRQAGGRSRLSSSPSPTSAASSSTTSRKKTSGSWTTTSRRCPFAPSAAETNLPLRVGLLVDASNSIRDRFKFEQEAAIEFLNQIVHQQDQAFVIGLRHYAGSHTELHQQHRGAVQGRAHVAPRRRYRHVRCHVLRLPATRSWPRTRVRWPPAAPSSC